MLRLLLASALLPVLLAACSGDTPVSRQVAEPGHGAVKIAVEPNPIVAKPLGNDLVGLPFDVVVSETGGLPVDVERLVLNVRVAGVTAYSLTYTAAQLRAAGQTTSIGASSSVRYAFHPKTRASDTLMGAATGEVTVVALDETSTPTIAATGVSVQ